MNITFDNKVAIVTGAAGGIGRVCAELLAEGGAKVALVDYHPEHLAEATKNAQAKGIAQGYRLDITNTPAIVSTVSRVRQELGEVDILVCCAGIAAPMLAEEATEADWDSMLAVNTKGLFFCNQAVAIQSMIPRKSGAIVNIASVTGVIGMPMPFMTVAYSASKGGVVQITRQEAVEWARYNIRVNAVAPTMIVTDMTKELLEDPEGRAAALDLMPLHRFGEPFDVAAAICFLASDAAKMITGVILPIDGGQTAQ